MRTERTTDGRQHPLDGAPNDHHPRPLQVTISDVATVIASGADFNLDLSLGHDGYQWGRAVIMGANAIGPTLWNEWGSVQFSRDQNEAIGHSGRDTGSPYKTYTATYSKQNGALNLTHKVFDSATSAGNKFTEI